mmetsp:Transcript_2413/g.4920  ORF Transcript_2413/g.4920 Transcript_2413/m.4920 type:complete len:120 (+) Transcript_2413:623-982(+)
MLAGLTPSPHKHVALVSSESDEGGRAGVEASTHRKHNTTNHTTAQGNTITRARSHTGPPVRRHACDASVLQGAHLVLAVLPVEYILWSGSVCRTGRRQLFGDTLVNRQAFVYRVQPRYR